jgi:hypothetical protein
MQQLASNRRYITGHASPSTSVSASNSIPPSPSATGLPGFTAPNLLTFRLNQETDNNLITSFTNSYERHCKEIFDLVSTNQVEKVRGIMNTFYGEMPEQYRRLIQSTPEITEAVWRWDCSLYDVSR